MCKTLNTVFLYCRWPHGLVPSTPPPSPPLLDALGIDAPSRRDIISIVFVLAEMRDVDAATRDGCSMDHLVGN